MKTKTYQKGFSTIEILLIIVVIGIVGVLGWYIWHIRHTNTKSISANTTSQASGAQYSANQKNNIDYSVNMQKFTTKLGGFTLYYPLDWKGNGNLATGYDPDGEPQESYTFTSPKGTSVSYVLSDKNSKVVPYAGQYETSACGKQSFCPVIVVDSIEKINIKNFGTVQLVKMGSNEKIVQGNYQQDPGYSEFLDVPDSPKSTYKLGETKLGEDMIIPDINKGRNVYYLTINFPESFSKMTSSEVFSSSEAKAAEEILKSITFQ